MGLLEFQELPAAHRQVFPEGLPVEAPADLFPHNPQDGPGEHLGVMPLFQVEPGLGPVDPLPQPVDGDVLAGDLPVVQDLLGGIRLQHAAVIRVKVTRYQTDFFHLHHPSVSRISLFRPALPCTSPGISVPSPMRCIPVPLPALPAPSWPAPGPGGLWPGGWPGHSLPRRGRQSR